MAEGDPTPVQRAEVVVAKLEKFIRDHRDAGGKGMSFRSWQDLARSEIAKAIAAAQRTHTGRVKSANWLLATVSSGMVTLGFWGVVWAVEREYGTAAALIMGVAGLSVLVSLAAWLIAAIGRDAGAAARERELGRIAEINSDIRRLRRALEKTRRSMEDEASGQG